MNRPTETFNDLGRETVGLMCIALLSGVIYMVFSTVGADTRECYEASRAFFLSLIGLGTVVVFEFIEGKLRNIFRGPDVVGGAED